MAKGVSMQGIAKPKIMTKARMRQIEKAAERRRELGRIRTAERRMKKRGFDPQLGDLSGMSTAQLRKLTTEKIGKKARAVGGAYAGIMTYADWLKMTRKERKAFETEGKLPKDLERNLKTRKRRKDKKEKGPEPPPMGDILLSNLEAAIKEGLKSFASSLATVLNTALQGYISQLGRKEAGRRLVILHTEKYQYVPLLNYAIYIPRGEEFSAREAMDTFTAVMENREPTKEEREAWGEIIFVDGVYVDPETGEIIE